MTIKQIKKPNGDIEAIQIYTDGNDIAKPRKVVKFVDGTVGYIPLTSDLTSPTASSKRVKIGDTVYAEMLKPIETKALAMFVSRDETSEFAALSYRQEEI